MVLASGYIGASYNNKEIDKITTLNTDHQSGHSVSISTDGRILMIGARYYSNNRIFDF